MSVLNLAETVEQHPEFAQIAFDRMEQALNLLLPGSNTHSRYQGIESVGLAAVIAGDSMLPGRYDPFDPATLGRVTFMADNRSLHPEAWTPRETDADILGGALPEDMGRFTAFALAKINTLTTVGPDFLNTNLGRRSHRIVSEIIAPGQVGYAGGLRIRESLAAISGLWEVHDHVANQLLVAEIGKEESGETEARNADVLAEDLESIFGAIKNHHKGVKAAEMKREEVAYLLKEVDDTVAWFLADGRV